MDLTSSHSLNSVTFAGDSLGERSGGMELRKVPLLAENSNGQKLVSPRRPEL